MHIPKKKPPVPFFRSQIRNEPLMRAKWRPVNDVRMGGFAIGTDVRQVHAIGRRLDEVQLHRAERFFPTRHGAELHINLGPVEGGFPLGFNEGN